MQLDPGVSSIPTDLLLTMELNFGAIPSLQVASICTCCAFVGYILLKAVGHSRNTVIYPPGPPQDPLIGNLRNFPSKDIYEKFCEWQKVYGDLVYVRFPGISILVVHKIETAHELLSKRSSINSGRSAGYLINELMGWKWSPAIRQPDKNHQEIKKMLRKGIGPQRVGSHDNLFVDCTKDLMLLFGSLQGDPTHLITNTTAQIVLRVAYGDKIWNTMGDELIRLNVEAVHMFEQSMNKLWFVDILPFLRFIPSWMPGAGFQRIGKRCSECCTKFMLSPWEQLVESHQTGTSGHSLGNDLLDEYGPSNNIRDALGVFFAAGVDTTTCVITNFLHIMFMFPGIARKVHEEIVHHVGKDRLPSIADRPSLPFTEAVWKETIRWRPALPIVIPHTSEKDQTINGYFIPKGSIIHPNYGFMLNDPVVWGDPEVFRPERFLVEHNPSANDLPNPTQLIFGFGTRVCSGQYLADREGFFIAATTMFLYSIVPLEGKEVPKPSNVQYQGEFIRYPTDFECRFVPRGLNAANLLSSLSLETKA